MRGFEGGVEGVGGFAGAELEEFGVARDEFEGFVCGLQLGF